MLSDADSIQRLLLTTVLAGAIGYERERHGRAAGFRTHILVGVGSCLTMLTGLYLMDALAGKAAVDPTRIAAQVISGIGFLGAGTILRFRASVRGLTTAASLWAVGGVGLAAGAGFVSGASVTALIILVALFGFSRLAWALSLPCVLLIKAFLPGAGGALGLVFVLAGLWVVTLETRSVRLAYGFSRGRALGVVLTPYLAAGVACLMLVAAAVWGLVYQVIRLAAR